MKLSYNIRYPIIVLYTTGRRENDAKDFICLCCQVFVLQIHQIISCKSPIIIQF